MKNKALFTSILVGISLSTLVGCQQKDNRIRLSFGSPLATEATELTYAELVARMDNGENMIVVTYDSIYSADCSCWTNFKKIVDKYVDDNDTIIYQIDRNEFEGHEENYGLTLLKENSNPTCFIASHGEVKNEYRAGSKNNEAIFKTEDGFSSIIKKVTKPAQIMLVNRDYLRNAIDSGDKLIVYQARNACGDCNYCTPNFLLPYSDNNELKTKIFLMDLQVPGIYYDAEMNMDTETYAAYKNEYQMTEATNAKYGYITGVVPTFQVWENKELKDACVYFNDSLTKVDDKWVVDTTYYTSERVGNLAYTNTVLKGKVVADEDVFIWGDNGYWNQDAAAKEHNPILESFLNYYAK